MRLTYLNEAGLNEKQQAVLDAIATDPRGAGMRMAGPFGVFVRAPHLGDPAQRLGGRIRFRTSLPENLKEVAICTVGAFHQSKFEFAAHDRLAQAAGVSTEPLAQLRRGETPDFEGDEALAWQVADQLLNLHRIDDATYQAMVDVIGEDQMIELVMTVGYYCLISHTLNAFQIQVTDQMTDPFPDMP